MTKTEKRKLYYEENKDHISAQKKEHYKKNKDKHNAWSKKYAELNKDRIKEYNKDYRVKNEEKLKTQKKEYLRLNADAVKENLKKYYILHCDKINGRAKVYYALNVKTNTYVRKAKKYRGGPALANIIQRVYEDSIKKYGTLTCYLCEEPVKFGKDQLEHKTPVSRGGGHTYENLGVSCAKCNNRKRQMTEKEYRLTTKKRKGSK